MAILQACMLLLLSVSIALEVTKLVGLTNATKAVGSSKIGHHALNGSSKRKMLVSMTHRSSLCRAPFLFHFQVAIELLRSDGNDISPGCIIVGLLHLSIEPAALLLSAGERFRSQCDSKLSARVHGGIILQSTSRLQHRLPRLLAPSAEFVFAVLCSSSLRKQLFQTRSSRLRNGNDFFVTILCKF